MKSKEAKALIGKEIEWTENVCPWRGGIVRRGIIKEVYGKNAMIDFFGTTDWKWLPDINNVKEVDKSEMAKT